MFAQILVPICRQIRWLPPQKHGKIGRPPLGSRYYRSEPGTSSICAQSQNGSMSPSRNQCSQSEPMQHLPCAQYRVDKRGDFGACTTAKPRINLADWRSQYTPLATSSARRQCGYHQARCHAHCTWWPSWPHQNAQFARGSARTRRNSRDITRCSPDRVPGSALAADALQL